MRYDSAVIHEVAERHYTAAAVTEVVWAVFGLLIGLAVGWVIGTRWEQPLSGSLAGAALGVGIGYWIGHLRALTLRFAAQMALCQAQIEENTRPSLTSTGTPSFSGPRGAGNRIGSAIGR